MPSKSLKCAPVLLDERFLILLTFFVFRNRFFPGIDIVWRN